MIISSLNRRVPPFYQYWSPDRSAVISAICVLSKALITINYQCTEIKVHVPEL